MLTDRFQTSSTLLIACLLLATGMAGCLGSEGESTDGRFASYEEARDAVVKVHEPANSTSPVRLGLIQPEAPEKIGTGNLQVVVLLFDSETNEPITDAEFVIDAYMPAMGHGTNPETNPSHEAHGVYVGSTTISMGGTWEINLTATLADGTTLDFQVPVDATGGGMDGGHDGHGNMSMENETTRYSSYSQAKDAPGRVYEPENASGPTRLKLLAPPDPTNVTQGRSNVTVLLFDQEQDAPIKDANLTLDAWMTSMGHGTSPEEAPAHAAHGVYTGFTTFSMEGKWLLKIDGTVADQTLKWRIPVDVGNVSETWGSGQAPAFEPYNRSFEDDVQSASYNETFTFTVKGANATIDGTFALGNGTMLVDELNLTILDPNGTALTSVVVNSDQANVTFTIEKAPVKGDYSARVTGQALDAHYRIDLRISPPSAT